ncbi:hypothetical protein [Actinacidiphila sp. bgisy167]|uniref:hypothetical protein n=1 Tax=Actinacidiphila sp. bgisy167 TaxID=3413797 RepID=UPI003D712780
MPRRRHAPMAAAVALAAAVSACGTLAERQDAASTVAESFERALSDQRSGALCSALAPTTRDELEQTAKQPCEEAILRAELPQAGDVRHVDVYGGQARVVLERDTLFLAHFPTGWKVSAAGCTPVPQQPYRCEIKGR